MHFLGGLCVALGFAVLPFFKINFRSMYTTFPSYMTVVLLVGLSWEVFEIVAGVNIIDEYFIGDTMLDLIMGIAGGAVGYGLVKRILTI